MASTLGGLYPAWGVIAMRRGERAGRRATTTAIALPVAVFVWMNEGNP